MFYECNWQINIVVTPPSLIPASFSSPTAALNVSKKPWFTLFVEGRLYEPPLSTISHNRRTIIQLPDPAWGWSNVRRVHDDNRWHPNKEDEYKQTQSCDLRGYMYVCNYSWESPVRSPPDSNMFHKLWNWCHWWHRTIMISLLDLALEKLIPCFEVE